MHRFILFSQNQKVSHRRHVTNCRFVSVLFHASFLGMFYNPAVCKMPHAYLQCLFAGNSGNLKKIFAQPPCYFAVYIYIYRVFHDFRA